MRHRYTGVFFRMPRFHADGEIYLLRDFTDTKTVSIYLAMLPATYGGLSVQSQLFVVGAGVDQRVGYAHPHAVVVGLRHHKEGIPVGEKSARLILGDIDSDTGGEIGLV